MYYSKLNKKVWYYGVDNKGQVYKYKLGNDNKIDESTKKYIGIKRLYTPEPLKIPIMLGIKAFKRTMRNTPHSKALIAQYKKNAWLPYQKEKNV